jgi:hypothetical protein
LLCSETEYHNKEYVVEQKMLTSFVLEGERKRGNRETEKGSRVPMYLSRAFLQLRQARTAPLLAQGLLPLAHR